MTANSNKVIYLYTDMLLVLRGKQFVKAIVVTNKLLLLLLLSKNERLKKKQYLKLLSTTVQGSSVFAVLFSRGSILNAAVGNYMKYPP